MEEIKSNLPVPIEEVQEINEALVPIEEITPQNNVTINPYQDIAKESFSEEIVKVLQCPIDDDDVEIRSHDGIIYYPEMLYRERLNRAFKPGGWAILPKESFYDKTCQKIYYKGALFIQGRFVAEAIGEQRYVKSNPNMSYATAHEGAKSDCLTRCCKDLGIASDLWKPRFIKHWLKKHTVQVWVVNQKTQEKKVYWRRIDDDPIDIYPWLETGLVKKSTNGYPSQPPKDKPVSFPETQNGVQNGDNGNGVDIKDIEALVKRVYKLHENGRVNDKIKQTWLATIEKISNQKSLSAITDTIEKLERAK